MKLVTTALEIKSVLIHLIEECSSCQIAVAWASADFEVFNVLLNNSDKISRMIVGIHFYQTHPTFIKTFLDNRHVRFVMNPNGVFHPNTYLFEMKDGWQLLVGSPNFTHSATSNNDEMAVLVSSADDHESKAMLSVNASMDDYWKKARCLSWAEWERYKKIWDEKQSSLTKLREEDWTIPSTTTAQPASSRENAWKPEQIAKQLVNCLRNSTPSKDFDLEPRAGRGRAAHVIKAIIRMRLGAVTATQQNANRNVDAYTCQLDGQTACFSLRVTADQKLRRREWWTNWTERDIESLRDQKSVVLGILHRKGPDEKYWLRRLSVFAILPTDLLNGLQLTQLDEVTCCSANQMGLRPWQKK